MGHGNKLEELIICDIENTGTFDDFICRTDFRKTAFELEGELKPESIFITPEYYSAIKMEEYVQYYSEQSKEVLYYLKDSGLNVELYDDGGEKREITLKSADVIIPFIVFIGRSAYTVGLSILSKYIYENWIKKKTQHNKSMKTEFIGIDFNKKIFIWKKIEGPFPEVHKELLRQSKREFK